ncbi:MAG TPA: hypothetical protein VJ904_10720, partial [Tichowtungia sp.]|nr:hypothetical protein [Tichowtungia sp.]
REIGPTPAQQSLAGIACLPAKPISCINFPDHGYFSAIVQTSVGGRTRIPFLPRIYEDKRGSKST